MFLRLTDYILRRIYIISYRLPGFVHTADCDSRKWNVCQESCLCSYRHDHRSFIPLVVHNENEVTCSKRGQNEGHRPEEPGDKKHIHESVSDNDRQSL